MQLKKNRVTTYLLATVVIIIWGLTFISTKILLNYIQPLEILVYRYIIAFITLWLCFPQKYKLLPWKDELVLACAGILGITLNFMFENTALVYSTTTNVSLLTSCAPMFTGFFAHFLTDDEKITKEFIAGCVFGMSGVIMIVLNGHVVLHLNPLGDILALCAATSFVWESLLIRKVRRDIPPIIVARRAVMYSLLSLIPLCFTRFVTWQPCVLTNINVICHLVFLGVFASALCLVLWNRIIWNLGAVRANNMLYLSPPVTVIGASILLNEKITYYAIVGGCLILMGVWITQRGNTRKLKANEANLKE